VDVRNFFDTISAVVAASDKIDEELALRLGTRFNVIDRINPSENGLSDILRDLLDPRGDHGQGQRFLRAFLDLCNINERWLARDMHVSVYRERRTTSLDADRRIDLLLRFDGASRRGAIAIENKPWAGEQENQMADYADDLLFVYGEAFHLVYLSGDGKGPKTLGRWDKKLRQTGRLHIIPYHGPALSSDGIPISLRGWVDACSREAEADKLRWFFRDLSEWIRRNFEVSGKETGAFHE
jgi:hypothetical protein